MNVALMESCVRCKFYTKSLTFAAIFLFIWVRVVTIRDRVNLKPLL